jgi:hypothetical protein
MRMVEEFVKFLSKAKKVKNVLTETNPDVGLVKSYQDEVTRKSWVETFPGKTIRFLVAAGTGFAASAIVGPVGGIAVGATNLLPLDKLLKGWRPDRLSKGLRGMCCRRNKCGRAAPWSLAADALVSADSRMNSAASRTIRPRTAQ